jgi:DNA-binding NarL/FixJ family response regulator
MNGIEATRRITAATKAPVVIILTLHDDPEYRQAAWDAGADGFVTKSQLRTELVPRILSCLATRKPLPQPGSTPKPEGTAPHEL